MTTEEIIEGNKLIAEFLGSKFINDAPEDYPNGYYYQPDVAKYDCPTGEPDKWCFNSSWDWLMPVVEKIEEIYNEHDGYYGVYISSNSCSIQGTNLHLAIKDLDGYGKVYFNEVILNTKIESTWKAVVEFIKWYNTQKEE